jgi:putative transcriptional regulator
VDAHPPSPDSPIRLQGKLLLADPSLRDGVFDRSVILLTEHSADDGAFGLILNQPTSRLVGELLTEEIFAPLRHLPVHEGGPVAREQLTFSAFWWSAGKGLRWAIRISAEEAIKHAHQPGTLVRAFVGYSGWSSGQLENEIRRNAWIITNPNSALLGADHDRTLWASLLREMSPYHRILAESPANPFLN